MGGYQSYAQDNSVQNFQDINIDSNKSNKIFWLLISLVMAITIAIVIFFLFIFSSSILISEDSFSKGINLNMEEEKAVKFILNDEKHSIIAKDVNSDYIDLIIKSDPISLRLSEGEESKLDINGDNSYDIKIKLNSISGDIFNLYIEKIVEAIEYISEEIIDDTCIESWECKDWSNCSASGIQTRDCTDLNNCGTYKNNLSEEQYCEYSGIINCGVAYPDRIPNMTKILDSGGEVTFKNYNEDEAFVCFGENLLGDCLISEVSSVDEFGDTEKIKTKGVVDGNCIVRFEIGDVSDSNLENKRFENTYLECPIPISDMSSLGCPLGACIEEGTPGQTTMGVLTSMFFQVLFNPSGNDCSGTMTEMFTGGIECMNYLDCQDYNETSIGFCGDDTMCQYVPFDGECRQDSDCPNVCENCVNETFRHCNLAFVAQNLDSINTDYIGRSSCISCFDSEDCLDGFICNGEGSCVVGEDCSEDSDCGSDEYCAFYPSVCTLKSNLGEVCEENMDSCINGICKDDVCVEEDFYDQFESCTYLDDESCTQSCTNCVDGSFSCPYVGSADGAICVECAFDSSCKDGYECELYECVLK